jgi:hypothetical protein
MDWLVPLNEPYRLEGFVELGVLTKERMGQKRAPLQGTFEMSVAGEDCTSWCAVEESYTRRLFTMKLNCGSWCCASRCPVKSFTNHDIAPAEVFYPKL